MMTYQYRARKLTFLAKVYSLTEHLASTALLKLSSTTYLKLFEAILQLSSLTSPDTKKKKKINSLIIVKDCLL